MLLRSYILNVLLYNILHNSIVNLFTDVMSFVGFLNIHPLTVYERTVYNMMNEKSLSILNVVKDLQTIYDSILSDIQLIVPEVVIIKVNPDFVER